MAFLARDHRAECAVVLSLFLKLPEPGRNDGRRGVEVDHSTINRWVLKFAPALDKRLRPHLSLTNDSWRVMYVDKAVLIEVAEEYS